MMRHAASFSVLAGGLAASSVRPALASAPVCSQLAVESDGALGARFPGLVERVHEAFDAREDIDRCARVELTAHDVTITMEVALPDGRTATRSTSLREDVVPTLEALLLLPRADPGVHGAALETPDPSSSAPDPVHRSGAPGKGGFAPTLQGGPPGRDRAAAARASPRGQTQVKLELSALAGARAGDGQAGFGLGAVSFLDVSGWLVGFEGRVDDYVKLDGEHSGAALELALLSGRRFRFDDIAVDLTAGPAAALQGTTTFEARSSATGILTSRSSTSTVPRLVVASRVNFGARATLHTFVGADGEVGPARFGGDDLPGAPRLPLWTVGLAFGATVGTR